MIFFAAARKHQLVPRGVQNIAESSVDFVRESVILQTIGPEGMGYLPFLTTMFFFVFFINIFEILPFIQFPGNARIAVPAVPGAPRLVHLQHRRASPSRASAPT